MSLNIDKMLTPLAGENSGAGVCFEYEAVYLELDKLASGVPQSIMGDSVVEGKDPDWRKLRQSCLELWDKTRDLRVATYFTVASLCLDGIEGLRDGLKVIKYLIGNNWDDFWPHLDPEEMNDPMERVNILAMLSPRKGSYSDPLMFIARFRDIKLLQNKIYTLRDYMVASGELESGDSSVNIQLLNGEMSSVPIDVISKRLEIVHEIGSLLDQISESVNSKIKNDVVVTFDSLYAELKLLSKFYSLYIPLSENVLDGSFSNFNESQGDGGNSDYKKSSSSLNISSYKPKNREEALLLLRKSADYFRKTEPTNPVPYILERALRISNMNFIDILVDIDPGSVARVKDQLGVSNDN